MTSIPPKYNANEDADSARGFYDAEPHADEDLWFLPPLDGEDDDDLYAAPLPRANHPPLIDIAAWRAAESALAGPLADLALQQGRLATRLHYGPTGWRHRLALLEAADLSWLAGDRISAERLALWQALRLPSGSDDTQALIRAGWVVRRLTSGSDPRDDLSSFLGRHEVEQREDSVTDQIADWLEVMSDATALHRLTRAALGFHIWPVTGLSAGHQLGGAAPLQLIEAATVAARQSMESLAREGTLFLPLALGGAGGLRSVAGLPEERLRRWIAGADQAAVTALAHLDRLSTWEARAATTCADLSGRTPPRLITLLRDWPLISAPMAEAHTGASRAAVQRNLNWMTSQGLTREVTGQGRYRFWSANL